MTDPTLTTFQGVRAGLLALIQRLTQGAFAPDGAGYQVVWENREQPFVDVTNGAHILLSTRGFRGLGIDEARLTFDGTAAPGHEYTETRCGNRLFSLVVKVESIDQTEGKTADYIISRLYSRMQWESSSLALNALNCSYVDAAPMVCTTQVRDQWDVAIAAVEFQFAWATNETDIDNPVGYIAEVIADGTINNPDGTTRPTLHLDVSAT